MTEPVIGKPVWKVIIVAIFFWWWMWHQNYTFQFFKSNRQECSELQNVRYYRAYIYLFIKRSHLYLRNVSWIFIACISQKLFLLGWFTVQTLFNHFEHMVWKDSSFTFSKVKCIFFDIIKHYICHCPQCFLDMSLNSTLHHPQFRWTQTYICCLFSKLDHTVGLLGIWQSG